MLSLLLALCLSPQANDAAATEAVTTFDAVLAKSKDPSARVAAVGVLSKVHHERVVGRLGALLSHDEKGLRIAAAQAMTEFKEVPELRKSAAHALSSGLSAGSNQKEPEVLVAILTAIGHLGDESSCSVLKSHFDDKDPQLAGAAITAAGALKQKNMVEPLIEELRDCEKKAKSSEPAGGTAGGTAKRMKTPKSSGGGADPSLDPETQKRQRAMNLLPTTQQALSVLTAQNFVTGDDWEKWWSKNRASFEPAK
jgi:HEAT repeat protein